MDHGLLIIKKFWTWTSLWNPSYGSKMNTGNIPPILQIRVPRDDIECDPIMTTESDLSCQRNLWIEKSNLALKLSKFLVWITPLVCLVLIAGRGVKESSHTHIPFHTDLGAARQHLNGQNHLRVRRILEQNCRCTGNCFRSFQGSEQNLLRFLRIFWNLKKTLQDAYVPWLIFLSQSVLKILVVMFQAVIPSTFTHPTQIHRIAGARGDPSLVRQWTLLGKPVVSRCVAPLIGMGYARLHSAYNGKVDMRHNCFGFVSCLHSGSKQVYLDWCIVFQTFCVRTIFIQMAQGTEVQGCQKDEGGHAPFEIVPVSCWYAPQQAFCQQLD